MPSQNSIKAIYAVVKDDFEGVNQQILSDLNSDVPLIEKIGHYIIESGGKRLRPLLVLLAAKAAGYSNNGHIKLAAVIEFLHTATLLHDDVVDTSDLRRGRPTANAKWGNAPSVLVGDFLYSRAFQMMVELADLKIMDILSNATGVISEGEVMQLLNIHNLDVSEADYMETIRCKTAMLFEAASHTAAILAGVNETQTKALQQYGHHLGMAFQLIDDVLDYRGDAEEMGKNVGDDLAEGKPTLPLIYTMKYGTTEQAELVRKAIKEGGIEKIEEIQAVVEASGALDYTQSQALKESEKAIEQLQHLPPSECRTAMETLAKFAVERAY